MTPAENDIKQQVVESFNLDSLCPPIELEAMARMWGVTEIEKRAIASDAMLLPIGGGYKVILKQADNPGKLVRQRFSFAHELGHLLLSKVGYRPSVASSAKHRGSKHNGHNREEERICDQLAAEILMPRKVFFRDCERLGWGLRNLRKMARLYNTSIPATAHRMVDLMPEACAMGIWKPAMRNEDRHALQQVSGSTRRLGIPSSTDMPRNRMWLVSRAARSSDVEEGIAPAVDKSKPKAIAADVAAEAWAWGRDEHRRVVVFYYPDRGLSKRMVALSQATRGDSGVLPTRVDHNT